MPKRAGATIRSTLHLLVLTGIVMRHYSSFATVNDFLHGVVIFGIFAVSAAGLTGELELFNFRSETALQIASNAVAEASIAIGTPFVQPHR
ncbi:MAG: hypothetical protein ACRECQ_12375 [Burkholderiaceae bacterium]